MFSSLLFAALAAALTYRVTKHITGNRIQSVFISICLVFGSLLTGATNVRNEEAFGYWLYICVYTLTFLKLKSKFWLVFQTVFLYYSVFSLPILILLAPLVIYRIFQNTERKQWLLLVVINLLCLSAIFVHNYVIFGQWIYSNYTIGERLNPGYRLGQFAFSLANWQEKLQFYFLNKSTSVFTNYPLIIFAVISIWISQASRLTKLITMATCLGFAFYITNIGELTGWLGYGSGRYMTGIFAVSYLYLGEIFRKFRPLLWLGLAVAAIISIGNGLFFYFSPIRNVYDRDPAIFKYLPFGGNFFGVVAVFIVGLFFLWFAFKRIRNKV
jgi:hypothetical protein